MELMRKREWKRLDALERVGRGELTMEEAARGLGLSKRQVRRLCRRIEAGGPKALEHGNRGRVPACRVPDGIRARVTELMRTIYVGFNDQHFTEKLAASEGIDLSRATVRRILRGAGVVAVLKRRRRKYRGRRKRKPQMGLMLLWDGSPHDWLEGRGPRLCLMAAVDDATSEIMPGAHFVEQEGSVGYLRVLLAIAKQCGLPWSIYMDRHSSLRRNDDHWRAAEELAGKQDPTHVQRALAALGVEPIYALSPEAKGRVERLWGTLQDRLVSEMRLAGARTLEEANALLEAYVPTFNRRFGVQAEDKQRAWRAVPPGIDLERTCSFYFTPTVNRDNTVSFEGTTFQLPPAPNRESYAGRRVELRLLLTGEVRIYMGDAQIACTRIAAPKRAPRRNKPCQRGQSHKQPAASKRTLTFKQIVAKVRRQRRQTHTPTQADRITELLTGTD
jgi:transposase